MLTTGGRSRGIALLSFALLARSAEAASPSDGGLVGLVEDNRGTPVSGAVVSLFGRGLRGSGVVTLTDASGRFFLPSLSAGSYTLRTIREGHHPAPAYQVTVVPDRDAIFTISLTPVSEVPSAEAKPAAKVDDATERTRELRWLLRHKRRSVLEETTHGTAWADASSEGKASLASQVSGIGGTVELFANPTFAGWGEEPGAPDGVPASLSVLRLRGHLGDVAEWSLAGLVAESEATAWRLGAEFVIDPGGGHQIRAGSGYGSRLLRIDGGPPTGRGENRGVGAVFVEDRFAVGDRVAATVGARLSHVGFLERASHFDPTLAVEVKRDARTRLTGTFSARTLAPGGDLLALSTLASSPANAYAVTGPELRAERAYRTEVGAEQDFGATRVSAHTYYEDVHDQLFNSFEGRSRSLRIVNAGNMASRGVGLAVNHRFGSSLSGSISYTVGHAWRASAASWGPEEGPPEESDFHDLVARLETRLPGTATRLSALYRLSRLSPADEAQEPALHIRFDVQLSQALPFIGSWTRADWDFLVAVRNLYYEPSEGAMLDELAVSNPPKRLLGGIAVRF